jgi:ribonuclease P protein component
MDSLESPRSPRRRVLTLPSPWQFRYCYDGERKIVTRHAVVFMRVPREPDAVRVGVVASRKVGGAVQRNRAKRVLREVSRALSGRWTDPSVWIVFVAKASIVERNAQEIRDDIERALVEAGALGASNIK